MCRGHREGSTTTLVTTFDLTLATIDVLLDELREEVNGLYCDVEFLETESVEMFRREAAADATRKAEGVAQEVANIAPAVFRRIMASADSSTAVRLTVDVTVMGRSATQTVQLSAQSI